jgi:hypothetical protein
MNASILGLRARVYPKVAGLAALERELQVVGAVVSLFCESV